MQPLSTEFKAFVWHSIQKILAIGPDDLQLTSTFENLGFNGLLYTKLAYNLNSAYQLNISPARFLDFATVEQFIEHYKTKLTIAHSGSDAVIIGFSARLPGCKDLDAFWQLLVEQKDVISTTPQNRRSFMQQHHGAFIEGFDEFDPSFFNISSTEAHMMDPQQRVLLQEVWRAIDMSGIETLQLQNTTTGVYVGASNNDYARLIARKHLETPQYISTGFCLLANRISYYFNLCGPSEAIDTGCSSSLYALNKAAQAIKNGEIDQAIVCGVNLLLDDEQFDALAKSGLLSASNQCRPFHDKADGILRGEGIIVIILRKEAFAEAEQNAIYAKILASGVNHSGKSAAFATPSSSAQHQLYKIIYSKVDLHRVSYVEMHGTGAPTADTIELEGWKQFVGPRSVSIKIGSLKGNIGHLESACGLAGLIKILLMFHHKKIPGLAHLKDSSSYAEPDIAGMTLCQQSQLWPTSQDPLCAGLSSFGLGGVNVHVVVEQGSALFTDKPPPKPTSPFLRKKFWFERPHNGIIYNEELLTITDRIIHQPISGQSLLLVYSSQFEQTMMCLSKELAYNNRVAQYDLAVNKIGHFQVLCKHTNCERIIVYLYIPPFNIEDTLYDLSLWPELQSVFELIVNLKNQFFEKSLCLDVYTFCAKKAQPDNPHSALVSGLLTNLSTDMTHWQVKHLNMDESLCLEHLEACIPGMKLPITYTDGQYQVKQLISLACTEEEEVLKAGATYLILGELQGLVQQLAYTLVEVYKSKLILIGKNSLNESALAFVTYYEHTIEFIQTDISQETVCDLLFKYLSLKYPTIEAAFDIMMAGLEQSDLANWPLFQRSLKNSLKHGHFIKQLQTKLHLKSAVCFSPLQSRERMHEAAANCSANAYVKNLRLIPGFKVKQIMCSPWEIEQAQDHNYHPQTQDEGLAPISIDEVLDAFLIAINCPYDQLIIQKKMTQVDINAHLPQTQINGMTSSKTQPFIDPSKINLVTGGTCGVGAEVVTRLENQEALPHNTNDKADVERQDSPDDVPHHSSCLVFLNSDQQSWVKEKLASIRAKPPIYYIYVDDLKQFEESLESFTENLSPLIYFFAGSHKDQRSLSPSHRQTQAQTAFTRLVKQLHHFPNLTFFVYSQDLYKGLVRSFKIQYPQWTFKYIDTHSITMPNINKHPSTSLPGTNSLENQGSEALLIFNQALGEFEHFCFHFIKYKLVTHGLVWREASANFIGFFPKFTQYVSQLLESLKTFEKVHYAHTNTNQIKTWDNLLQLRLEMSKKYSFLLPYFNLVAVCVDQWVAICHGEKTLQEVLFPYGQDTLVKALYKNSELNQRHAQVIAEKVIQMAMKSNKPLKVVHIGDGTEAIIAAVLKCCKQNIDYTYIDILPQKVSQIQAQFQHQASFKAILMDINRLNLNQSADIIITSNAMVLALNISQCLARIRSLISNNGLLIFAELTPPALFLALTSDIYENDSTSKSKGTYSPKTLATWVGVLKDNGFKPSLHPFSDSPHQSIILAALQSDLKDPGTSRNTE
ncbi:MAG: hypothetical protein H0U75_06900 [Legionella sp.]|nr:hypothetical protein [Legionella sp.]